MSTLLKLKILHRGSGVDWTGVWGPERGPHGTKLGYFGLRKVRAIKKILADSEQNVVESYNAFRKMELAAVKNYVGRLEFLRKSPVLDLNMSVVEQFNMFLYDRQEHLAWTRAHDGYGLGIDHLQPKDCILCPKKPETIIYELMTERDTAISDCIIQNVESIGTTGLVASLAMGGGYLVYLSACIFLKTEPCLPMTITM